MISKRSITNLCIAAVGMCLSSPMALADGWGGPAPSYRLPPPAPSWSTVVQTPRLKEPQAMLPPPDPSSRAVSGISVQQRPNPLLDLNPAGVSDQQDQYTSSPQVDSVGVRHFSNGRHFDLSSMSIRDAVAQTNASTLGRSNKQQLSAQNEQEREARRQARMQTAMMRRSVGFQNGGFQNGGVYGGGGYGFNGNSGSNSYWNNQNGMQPAFVPNYQNGLYQPYDANNFQGRGTSQFDMNRVQRRAMRRRAREMQLRNYNF